MTEIRLSKMSSAMAEAILAGVRPTDPVVASDYPTEFSVGVAGQVAHGGELGPYCIHSLGGEVVGEIGGASTEPGTVEIGYAVVQSCWGRGIATAAVEALLHLLAKRPDIVRVVAHTPLDRPASARVVEKAGFRCLGELEDQHDGLPIRVRRWEYAQFSATA